MMTRTQVALVGAGNMATRYHYPSLASFPDVELAGICDLVPGKAEKAAERFGIGRVYADYRQMLAEVEPEAVWVLMPPQHLFEPASEVLRQGRHLFVEKPLGMTTYQAHALADLAEAHDCLTMVGFQRRHVPAMTELRRRAEERGPIHHATVDFYKSTRQLDRHAGFWDGVIDPLTSDGIHAVDTLRWLCGGEVEQVHASVQRLAVPGPFPNHYVALVTFSTGAVGVLQFGYLTGRRVFRMELHTPNATVFVDPEGESWIVLDDGPVEKRLSKEWLVDGATPGSAAAPPGAEPGPEPGPERWLGFWHENRHFVDCVRERRQPASHFADAVKTMELVERIIRAGDSAGAALPA